MWEQRSRRAFLAGTGAALLAGTAGCLVGGIGDGGGERPTSTRMADSMTIFHAGSLGAPFGAAEPRFEDEYDVDVNREAQGSVASTQKITQQGRSADALGVSDFRLIRGNDGSGDVDLLPEYGNWYAIFTTNAMSIQYREDSPGADDISTDNWWEVLTRDGITIGHSDPAVDPGGYRAVMTQQLGTEPFDGERLYDEATYEALRENSVVPTGTETNLEGQLESGEIDYVMYYQSIASTSGKPFVDLPPAVDLSRSTTDYARHYAKAEVETSSGAFTGAPIAYGLTVPSVAEAPGRGAQWVEYFGTEPGRAILEEQGLVPVNPIVVPEHSADQVPDRVMDIASAQANLGPLEL